MKESSETMCLSCDEGKLSFSPAVVRAVTGRGKAASVNHIGGVYPHSSGGGEGGGKCNRP